MTQLLRVKAKRGPAHEFYAGVDEVRVHPEKYVVLDETPVPAPGRTKYVSTADTKSPRVAQRRSVKKPPAPQAAVQKSVGEKKEEA